MAGRGAALVTGGARRIGRVLATTAAEAGYDVAIHVRAIDDEAEAAAGEVRRHGRKATLLTCTWRPTCARPWCWPRSSPGGCRPSARD